MKSIGYLVLAVASALPQTNVQVDVIPPVMPPVDNKISIERTTAPYTIVLTNNTDHAITGLVVEWAAGGSPQVLLLGHYGFKEAVVPAKGMMVLAPPNQINVIPVSMDRSGRRIVGPAAPPSVSRVVIHVATVIFDDGNMIGTDRYELVRTITARTELPAALAAASAKWAAKKPDVYEFIYKQICFCVTPPPGKPGSEPIVFRVLNGIGYLQGAWADRPEARQEWEKYSTVEKQFTYIRSELAKQPYRAEIEYDPDDGHPTRVYIDPLQNTADEEYGFTVMGFTRLER
jgi:hypothetical protein